MQILAGMCEVCIKHRPKNNEKDEEKI